MAGVQPDVKLMNLYLDTYKDKYDRMPKPFNRFANKWGFKGMVDDLGYDRAAVIVKYYFETRRADHPVQYLLYNYEKIDAHLTAVEDDARVRAEIREQTRRLVEGIEGT